MQLLTAANSRLVVDGGHNQSPEGRVDDPPIDQVDLQVALAAMPVLRRLVQSNELDRDALSLVARALEAGQRMIHALIDWSDWAGEFAKQFWAKYDGHLVGAVAIFSLEHSHDLVSLVHSTVQALIALL